MFHNDSALNAELLTQAQIDSVEENQRLQASGTTTFSPMGTQDSRLISSADRRPRWQIRLIGQMERDLNFITKRWSMRGDTLLIETWKDRDREAVEHWMAAHKQPCHARGPSHLQELYVKQTNSLISTREAQDFVDGRRPDVQ